MYKDTNKKPSAIAYVISGIIACLALIGFFVSWTAAYIIYSKNALRLPIEAPAVKEVKIQRTGAYRILFQNRGFYNGQYYDQPDQYYDNYTVTLKNEAGEFVKLHPVVNKSYYHSDDGTESILTHTFKIEQPNTYKITIEPKGNNDPRNIIIIVESSGIGYFLLPLFLAFPFSVIFIVAVAIFWITFVRRKIRDSRQESDSVRK